MFRQLWRALTIFSALTFALVVVSSNHPALAQSQTVPSIHPASSCGSCDESAGFTYTATAANTSGYITTISYPGLDGQPNMALQVTQTWPNAYDPHPFGVWYNRTSGHWTIFNEDLTSIPLGTSFNISSCVATRCSAGADSWEVFQTTATPSNSAGDWTAIDNRVTNNNPDAAVLVTQNWIGTYDPHQIGVWYNGSRWAIFNEDGSAIPAGASFNVKASTQVRIGPGEEYFQMATAANNLAGYIMVINNPAFNGNSNLQLLATQVWNVNGNCGCVYNNHPIGTWYDSALQEWTVYNVDRAPIPAGAQFLLSIPVW